MRRIQIDREPIPCEVAREHSKDLNKALVSVTGDKVLPVC